MQLSYSDASSSWGLRHSSVVSETQVEGGMTYSTITYYSDAKTLCDGHARVTYSPAIPTSTATITTTVSPLSTSVYPATVGWIFPVSSPACSIKPSDCDSLYKSYSSESLRWAASGSAGADAPLITASPIIPPCVNSSQSSSAAAFESSFRACGPCTIFGNNVQLLYFPVPTNVSRDMCAATPSASLTHYDKDVVEVYTGPCPTSTNSDGTPLETAVYNGQTFTSGMAYISIETVWAGDRCSPTLGSTVSGAVLAMPSESVLSLRYSQDHFQYFYITSTQTGYPFDYADMRKPIPWSAWNGQQMCRYGDPCDIIYEDDFNPQLAIPPGIKKLRPEFENCQMWYGGLYDPPYALQPATALAIPTVPGGAATSSASQASFITLTTPIATALAETTEAPTNQIAASATLPANAPFTTVAGLPIGQDQYASGAITFAGYTLKPGDPDTIIGGVRISAATSGVVLNGNVHSYSQSKVPTDGEHVEQSQTALVVPNAASTNQNQGQSAETPSPTVIFTAGGQTYSAAVEGNKVIYGSQTLSIGGAAATLPDGQVVSAATDGGVVVQDITIPSSTLAASATAPQRGAVFSLSGSAITASQVADQTGVAVVESHTISVGGSAYTLADGQVATLVPGGLVVGSSSSTVSFSDMETSSSLTTRESSKTMTKGTTTTNGVAVVASSSSLSSHTSSTKSGAGVPTPPTTGLRIWCLEGLAVLIGFMVI